MMPQLGETVTEGTITRWMKGVGDAVERDEPLFEVSTDKVDSEVPSPAAGVLSEILVPEGETVEVGVKLAVIGDGAATAPAQDAPAAAAAEPAPGCRGPAATSRSAPRAPAPPPAPAPAPRRRTGCLAPRATVTGGRASLLSPMVRKLLAENGISESEVTGTGSGGRITRDDAQRAVEARRAAAPPPAPARRLHPPPAHRPPRPRPPHPWRGRRRPRPSPWPRSGPLAIRSCPSPTCGVARRSTWCDRRRRHPTRSSPTRSTSRASSVCARPG